MSLNKRFKILKLITFVEGDEYSTPNFSMAQFIESEEYNKYLYQTYETIEDAEEAIVVQGQLYCDYTIIPVYRKENLFDHVKIDI